MQTVSRQLFKGVSQPSSQSMKLITIKYATEDQDSRKALLFEHQCLLRYHQNEWPGAKKNIHVFPYILIFIFSVMKTVIF